MTIPTTQFGPVTVREIGSGGHSGFQVLLDEGRGGSLFLDWRADPGCAREQGPALKAAIDLLLTEVGAWHLPQPDPEAVMRRMAALPPRELPGEYRPTIAPHHSGWVDPPGSEGA